MFIGALIVMLLGSWFIWMFSALHIGAVQRMKIIDLIFDHDPPVPVEVLEQTRVMEAQFSSVKFDDHIWRVTTFRNPASLYPEPLRTKIIEAGILKGIKYEN